MEIENWSEIVPSILKMPINIYKKRYLFQKAWKHILAYINKGDTNVVVTGRSNVGKSVMTSYLYGETAELLWRLPSRSVDVEVKALTLGDWTKIVRVIPGQTSMERHQGLNEAFNRSSKLEGIIYVVDWGFTDVRDKTMKQITIENKGLRTIQDLREYNLALEIEDFKKVCEDITRAFAIGKSPKWLLIIANKTDLFFDNKTLKTAQQYYHPEGDSEFSKIIQSTINEIGKTNFKCASIPLCSFEKDLVWNNEIAKTQIGGEENRKALMVNFFNTIASFNA